MLHKDKSKDKDNKPDLLKIKILSGDNSSAINLIEEI